jgi:organic hydroperoxide reductase OsmC/OhrA
MTATWRSCTRRRRPQKPVARATRARAMVDSRSISTSRVRWAARAGREQTPSSYFAVGYAACFQSALNRFAVGGSSIWRARVSSPGSGTGC